MSENRLPNQHLLVGTDWLQEHLSDADLRPLEVTPPGSGYAIGHIPGAAHLNLATIFTGDYVGVPDTLGDPAKIAAALGGLGISPDHHVVVYDENGGTRAARTFWMLELLGFDRVSVLDGGVERWMAEGRTCTRSKPDHAPVSFEPKLQTERLGAADWIEERLNSEQTLLVDCRDDEEFAAGHIPGAVHRPWRNSVVRHAFQTMALPAELQAQFDALGASAEKEIVTYCGTGARSAHTYFTLRLLGYDRLRNYNGSWNEWGARPDLPKE